MKRTMMWLTMFATVIGAGSASAFPISVDGNWSDWTTYGGSIFNDWNQAAAAAGITNGGIRVVDDEEGAFGGQPYDIEQLFYYFKDSDNNALTGGTLYIGMVTGFPASGVDDIFAGDLFVGFGSGLGIADLTVGIGVAPAVLGDVNNGGRYGQAYGVSGVGDFLDPDPGPIVASRPWRVDLDNVGTSVTDVTGTYSPVVAWGGIGVHNFLEVAIQIDGLTEEQIRHPDSGGLSLHWTMGCGNDVISVFDTVPFAPVPEPTTMVLLGMGVLGMAMRTRRPRC